MENPKIRVLVSYWLPIIIWAAVIFSFSSYPTGTATKIVWTDFIIKKTAHVVEFAVLTVLLYRAFKVSRKGKLNSALYAILISAIYGISDEFHQFFTPGREPRLRDVGFDTIGSVLAIYLIWNILPKAPQKLRSWAKKLEII